MVRLAGTMGIPVLVVVVATFKAPTQTEIMAVAHAPHQQAAPPVTTIVQMEPQVMVAITAGVNFNG